MPSSKIEVTAPEALLDSNLKFPKEAPLIRHLTVTRERCIDPTLVDSFLRLLRYGSDDNLGQRLSAYVKFEKDGPFNEKKCDKFLNDELYANWQARDRIIYFCNGQLQQMKSELDQEYGQGPTSNSKAEVDLRIDPYAARSRIQEQESRYKEVRRLETWMENQLKVESILKYKSNQFLKQECDQNADYLRGFWKFQQGRQH